MIFAVCSRRLRNLARWAQQAQSRIHRFAARETFLAFRSAAPLTLLKGQQMHGHCKIDIISTTPLQSWGGSAASWPRTSGRLGGGWFHSPCRAQRQDCGRDLHQICRTTAAQLPCNSGCILALSLSIPTPPSSHISSQRKRTWQRRIGIGRGALVATAEEQRRSVPRGGAGPQPITAWPMTAPATPNSLCHEEGPTT